MYHMKKDHEEAMDSEVRREAERVFEEAERRRRRTEPVPVPFEQRYREGLLPGTYTETSHSGDVLTAFGYTQTEYEEDIGYIMRNNGVAMMEAHEILISLILCIFILIFPP